MFRSTFNLTAIQVSLTASFAGLYAVLSLLPAFKILGGNGFIYSYTFVEPVIGVVLGPYVGSLSVLVGRIVAHILVPSSPLGPFSPIPGVVTAFSAGMTSRGKWYISALVLFGLITTFLVYSPNHIAPVFPYYVWLHLVMGVTLVLSSRLKPVRLPFHGMRTDRLLAGLVLVFFPSTMAGQLAGTLVWEFLIGEAVTGVWKAFGMTIMFAFPVERTLITIIACFLGASLIKALHGLGMSRIGSATTLDT